MISNNICYLTILPVMGFLGVRVNALIECIPQRTTQDNLILLI